jgi:hypothetical protein
VLACFAPSRFTITEEIWDAPGPLFSALCFCSENSTDHGTAVATNDQFGSESEPKAAFGCRSACLESYIVESLRRNLLNLKSCRESCRSGLLEGACLVRAHVRPRAATGWQLVEPTSRYQSPCSRINRGAAATRLQFCYRSRSPRYPFPVAEPAADLAVSHP